MNHFEELTAIRDFAGARHTRGLEDDVVRRFLDASLELRQAVAYAAERHRMLRRECPELLQLPELALCDDVRAGFLNFYADEYFCQYVPLAAKGPWLVTTHGGVLYDTGGYGMLGFGHAPERLVASLSAEHVMANVLTPSISQRRFIDRMRRQIGIHRPEKQCPYSHFACVNSGSEAMTVIARLSDVHAKRMTDAGGEYAGRKPGFLSLQGSFHGRTERPALASHSTVRAYQQLASFRQQLLFTVPANDIEQLKLAFETADRDGIYIEAMFLEPVQGEGNPGCAITPDFYAAARELSRAYGSLLIVDSIQAGFRAQGVLSIVDYPGFTHLPPPDAEGFSKALSGGQYPFSAVALSPETAALYRPGLYGNTMAATPRALEAACSVLDGIDEDLRRNIRTIGREFLGKLEELRAEFPNLVLSAQGTGLLLSLQLIETCPVIGPDGVERQVQRRGINVIHGGRNSLRFTPPFHISSAEVDLIIHTVRQVLREQA